MSSTVIAEFIAALLWPIVVMVALLLFRASLNTLLRTVGERATRLSLLNISLELAALPEFQPPQSLDQIRELTSDLGSQSSETAIFQELVTASNAEFIIIDLGSPSKPRWLTSRLYIFALLLERMRGIRCIVFVESSDDKRRSYIGCAFPTTVRWALASRYPWLEQSYAAAYSGAAAQPEFRVLSQWGTLPSPAASMIVQQFLSSIRRYPEPGQLVDDEWVDIPNKGQEHAKWIDVPRLERILGPALFRAAVPASLDLASNEVALRVLRRPVPFVARVSDHNRFETLVDRGDLLEQLALREAKVHSPTA